MTDIEGKIMSNAEIAGGLKQISDWILQLTAITGNPAPATLATLRLAASRLAAAPRAESGEESLGRDAMSWEQLDYANLHLSHENDQLRARLTALERIAEEFHTIGLNALAEILTLHDMANAADDKQQPNKVAELLRATIEKYAAWKEQR